MKKLFYIVAVLSGLVLAGNFSPARATDDYGYKPDEYLVIGNGLAPNKQLSIAAHGGPEEGDTGNFHLYLRDAKKQKTLTVLNEVSAWMDTGVSAYRAMWSPDSRHVAVAFRSARQAWDVILYRVEDGRLVPVTGPELCEAAVPGFAAKGFVFANGDQGDTEMERKSSLITFLELKWVSATRFELFERSNYRHVMKDPSAVLGLYGQSEKMTLPGGGYEVQFSAKAVCELAAGDKFRVVSVKPGPFKVED